MPIKYEININKVFEPTNDKIEKNSDHINRSSVDDLNTRISNNRLKNLYNSKIRFVKSCKKSLYENEINENFMKSFKRKISIGSNFFTTRTKNEDINKKYYLDISPKKYNEANKSRNKKKKKKKDLDIISLNLKKTSQNLNQPDIFYAGLFSELIFKDNPEKK